MGVDTQRRAGERRERAEHGDDVGGSEGVGPLQRPGRVVGTELHRRVDVFGGRNAFGEQPDRLVSHEELEATDDASW